MAKTPDTPPSGKIVISLHQLFVEVEHEASYPDQMTDLSNRVLELLRLLSTTAKRWAWTFALMIRTFLTVTMTMRIKTHAQSATRQMSYPLTAF